MRIAKIIDQNLNVTYALQCEKGGFLRIDGNIFSSFTVTDQPVTVRQFLAPVAPPAIFCIGLNYRNHAIESGMKIPEYPIIFMKNPSAATGHNQPIRIPAVCGDEVDYECELVVVIVRECRNVTPETANDYILGYTAGNDVSARIWQTEKGGGQWVRAKSFDTFAPLGPVIVTKDEIENPNDLAIQTSLNGQVVQKSNTADMIFSVPQLVAFLSQDTTLLPGTVIMTGTPEGVGWMRKPRKTLHKGDTVVIEIEKIGQLQNFVN